MNVRLVRKIFLLFLIAGGIVNIFKVNGQAPATFVHPGAMNNQADLDFVKAKIAAGEQPWLGEFNQVVALATAGNNAVAPTDENGQKADARKAYANALAWYYTGNATYAQNAIGILNTWGNTFTGYTPTVGQNQLQGGWIGALLGPAAEIMRGYAGWNQASITTVQNMFKTRFYPVLNTMSTWNGNVDLTQIDAMMNIAVFCDDQAEFNLGIQRLNARNPLYFYLASEGMPSNSGDWFAPTQWVNGLTQETCRDNDHHAQYALASALHAAEVAWNQGVDVYGPNAARYTAALELMALQVQSGQMQGTCGNNTTTADLYDTWEVGYNHYHNRMGMNLPNTLAVLTNKVRVNGQSDWNIFFETLTHNLDGSVPGCSTPAPTVSGPINYSVNDVATTLSATGTDLKWYTTFAGVGSAIAPTPSTAIAGTTTYYVSQTLNGCEGSKASIVVNVLNLFLIPKTLTPPTIDGTIDPVWASNTSVQSFTKTIVGTVSNAADLSGTFKAMWDNNYLYILGNVTDDTKMNDSPEPYFDDAIELYLDINNDKANTYGANDAAYTFGWNDGTTISTTPNGRSTTNITYSMVTQAGGYIFEARIPWTTIQGNPTVGQLVGFDFHVNDDDNGGTRDGKLSWNAATDDAWQNPSLFGTAKLGDVPITMDLDLYDTEQTSASDLMKIGISIFPNPSNATFHIESIDPIKLIVMDNLGRRIEELAIESYASFGTGYKTGLYHIMIITEKGELKTTKLIKEN